MEKVRICDEPFIKKLMIEDPELTRKAAKVKLSELQKDKKTGYTWSHDGKGEWFKDDMDMTPVDVRP